VIKGREEWKYWTATPGDLAEIGQAALDLVEGVAKSVSFAAEVSAPAFDASFLTPAQLRSGLKPEDLTELTSVEIRVDEEGGASVPARICLADPWSYLVEKRECDGWRVARVVDDFA